MYFYKEEMKDTYYIVCQKFIHQKVTHNPTEFIRASLFSNISFRCFLKYLLKSVI